MMDWAVFSKLVETFNDAIRRICAYPAQFRSLEHSVIFFPRTLAPLSVVRYPSHR